MGDISAFITLPLDDLVPTFDPSKGSFVAESPSTQNTITTLSLTPHMEGGYYTQTHVNPLLVPSPFPKHPASKEQDLPQREASFDPAYRCLDTSIFYYLTPNRPRGAFHRNRCAIVHSLHRGRGMYVIIHPSGIPGESRVETYMVGHGIENREKLQWTVDGGAYKASFLLPDNPEEVLAGSDAKTNGLLITEVAVPGFEFYDHDFLTKENLVELVGEERAKGLEWLVRGPWDGRV
ncbi:hypothetical protein MKZ38_004171 [Zalerion maritima]|uniref:DUF985 domain-containing protein n=1 Tax=Zalerion maritima TaxID=339359 RepID=A0AAD5RT33_9PEZI|nr:hypothetical protein MKZ38_004171 [Zalerion maritima]